MDNVGWYIPNNIDLGVDSEQIMKKYTYNDVFIEALPRIWSEIDRVQNQFAVASKDKLKEEFHE